MGQSSAKKQGDGGKKSGQGSSSSRGRDNSLRGDDRLEVEKAKSLSWGLGDYDGLRAAIDAMSPAVRTAIRRDPGVRGQINERDPDERTALFSLLMQSCVVWEDYSDTKDNDYTKALGEGDLSVLNDMDQPSMNCWQQIMFSDYLAGNCSESDLAKFDFQTSDWRDHVEPIGDGAKVGQAVVAEGLTPKFPRHMMLGVGGGDMTSHDSGGNECKTVDLPSQKDMFHRAGRAKLGEDPTQRISTLGKLTKMPWRPEQ